jgi:hypothetical protein
MLDELERFNHMGGNWKSPLKNTTLFCPLKKDGAIWLGLRTEIVFLTTTQQFQGKE